jgi:hypothetical protein
MNSCTPWWPRPRSLNLKQTSLFVVFLLYSIKCFFDLSAMPYCFPSSPPLELLFAAWILTPLDHLVTQIHLTILYSPVLKCSKPVIGDAEMQVDEETGSAGLEISHFGERRGRVICSGPTTNYPMHNTSPPIYEWHMLSVNNGRFQAGRPRLIGPCL